MRGSYFSGPSDLMRVRDFRGLLGSPTVQSETAQVMIRRSQIGPSAEPSVCTEIIDTQLAFATGRDGTDVMLVRLDSLSRQQLFTVRDIRVALNLTLVKLLEESGDLQGALDVLSRRRYGASGALQGLSTFLYEEARLAAMVGDRERAIRASELYLNLRSDPEPPYLSQADSVRERLRLLRLGT